MPEANEKPASFPAVAPKNVTPAGGTGLGAARGTVVQTHAETVAEANKLSPTGSRRS